MNKVGRNDPCPCGSGKKFKKCCQEKMIGKKFFAEKVASPVSQASQMTSLFQNQMSSQSSFFSRNVQQLSSSSVTVKKEETKEIIPSASSISNEEVK